MNATRTTQAPVDDGLRKRLLGLDTCVLSDALDRSGVRGVAFGLGHLAGPRRIAGRAITVTLGPAEGGPAPRHLCTAAVEAGGAGHVVVVEHHSTVFAAGWGGILSFAAKLRGVEGAIIDGMARDIDEAEGLGFPVFAAGAVPATARSRIMEVACMEPVVIRGVRVRNGDWVRADGSGVVFIPASKFEEVVELAEALAERERRMMDRLSKGEPVSEVMNQQYESMLKES